MPEAISPDLEQRLRAALLRCGPFDSDSSLRAVFVDARIAAWREDIPDNTPSRGKRVAAFIEALLDQSDNAGNNALALVLRVLADRTPSGDSCHREMAGLADAVQAVARTPDATLPASASADSALRQINVVNSQVGVIGDYAQVSEIHFHIEPPANPGELTGVELNVYSYFNATPASLRRSFDALMKDKLQGFVGRQFVFEALDDFLRTHDSGYFILRGVSGIGKSAFMAKLVNERGYIHHFNIASQNISSTRTFLENIIAQLIARYDLSYEEIPPRALDDSGFLMQCLSEAAEKCENSEDRIVIAIDSLDEVDRLGLAAAVNTLYLPLSLPLGVYVVVTTRPLDDMRLQVAQQRTFDLEADSGGNLQDITTYIETYARREPMQTRLIAWGISQAKFVARLRKKSQGNFMYLYYVLPAIEQGKFVHSTLDELPDGLMAYYRHHWRQMREGNEKEFDTIYEPIICILGVAQESVTTQQIANWTKLSHGQVKANIGRWRKFLEKERVGDEQYYRIYHASFQDFLKEQVRLEPYDARIANYYLELAGLQ